MDLTNINNMMVIFDILIAVFVLYYAIKGTGKAYENDYPKAMKEEHSKFLRKFFWIIGVGMLVFSLLEYLNMQNAPEGEVFNIFTIFTIVYVLGCVTVYYIMFRKKFKQYLDSDKPEKKKK